MAAWRYVFYRLYHGLPNMNIKPGDFPFNEIRRENGDYFATAVEAVRETGFPFNQVWSVTECDGTFCYGPAYHYVNLIGFIATKETHDNDTYYEESTNED